MMKPLKLLASGSLALSAMITPIGAPMAATAATVVTKVHGPLKILPHHNRKYCRIRWYHHHRVKKCWYH